MRHKEMSGQKKKGTEGFNRSQTVWLAQEGGKWLKKDLAADEPKVRGRLCVSANGDKKRYRKGVEYNWWTKTQMAINGQQLRAHPWIHNMVRNTHHTMRLIQAAYL
jgi:hypothetical protein